MSFSEKRNPCLAQNLLRKEYQDAINKDRRLSCILRKCYSLANSLRKKIILLIEKANGYILFTTDVDFVDPLAFYFAYDGNVVSIDPDEITTIVGGKSPLRLKRFEKKQHDESVTRSTFYMQFSQGNPSRKNGQNTRTRMSMYSNPKTKENIVRMKRLDVANKKMVYELTFIKNKNLKEKLIEVFCAKRRGRKRKKELNFNKRVKNTLVLAELDPNAEFANKVKLKMLKTYNNQRTEISNLQKSFIDAKTYGDRNNCCRFCSNRNQSLTKQTKVDILCGYLFN